MVAINIAPDENAQVTAWRRGHNYTFPIVLADSESFATTRYGVSAAPVNLLLNAECKAICRYAGADPGSEVMLEAEIRNLLDLEPKGGRF